MKFTRRDTLRGLAATSLLPLVQSCSSSSAQTPDTAYVNLILHGLFFMRFVQGVLIVQTPQFDDHKLFAGANGFLVELSPGQSFDLTGGTTKLKTGTVDSFKQCPQVPQFSIGQVNVGDFTGNYRLQIILPKPESIVPLRRAKLGQFANAAQSGNVANSVYASCGGTPDNPISLVTCLRYEKTDSFGAPPVANWIFYAEHKNDPHVIDVNSALKSVDATKLFKNQVFDLRFKDALAPTVCPDVHPGYGISPDDENALFEISAGKDCASRKGTDVANCVQFGING
jgi:hypothetical protein